MNKSSSIGVAFSGGVDSAVCVKLLQAQGYTVEAWHMLTLHPTADERTLTLADALKVPLHIVDLRAAFEAEVITPFYDAYARGFTPNPCALCNPRLKFGHLRRAINGPMATGHYVGKAIDPVTGALTLRCANDKAKDQSYFLAALTPEDIRETLFPLADKTRAEIVALAQQWNLPIPQEKLASGSQDICFLPNGDYRTGLCQRYPETATPGNILDLNGKILGRHTGLANYTRGQRKGLGIATGGRAFVVDFDRDKNTLTLGPKEALEKTTFHVREQNWLVPPTFPLTCQAVTRYHHPAFECTLDADGTVHAHTPQTLITPGQTCAFYRDNLLLGGAIIQ